MIDNATSSSIQEKLMKSNRMWIVDAFDAYSV